MIIKDKNVKPFTIDDCVPAKKKRLKVKKYTDKNGYTFIEMKKDEFDEHYIVGYLWRYESNGHPNSKVVIKVDGKITGLSNIVIKKGLRDDH